ncbi:hypothetical protein [Streptomyces sp. NPDC047928]|uniref:hypothetical protein n=1 Tax=Streptomyces sp. NPDC047928 TaxID=3365492 RepID=UPI00370FED7B
MTSTTGEYARIEFQANGEIFVTKNTYRLLSAHYEVWTYSSTKGWTKLTNWTLRPGSNLNVNYSIAEGVRVSIKVCVDHGLGCAGNNRLVA